MTKKQYRIVPKIDYFSDKPRLYVQYRTKHLFGLIATDWYAERRVGSAGFEDVWYWTEEECRRHIEQARLRDQEYELAKNRKVAWYKKNKPWIVK